MELEAREDTAVCWEIQWEGVELDGGGSTQCLVARRCIEVDSGLGGGSRTRSGCKGL